MGQYKSRHLGKTVDESVDLGLTLKLQKIKQADVLGTPQTGETAIAKGKKVTYDKVYYDSTLTTPGVVTTPEAVKETVSGVEKEVVFITEKQAGDVNQLDYTPKTGTTRNLVDAINEALGNTIVEVKYADLMTLITDEKLKPGMKYKITDFATTLKAGVGSVVGDAYAVIVTAISKTTLGKEGIALSTSWQALVNYSVDADNCDWVDASSSSFKGVITWMKDKFNNEAYYDFKTIKMLVNGTERYTFGDSVEDSTSGNSMGNIIGIHYSATATKSLPLVVFGANSCYNRAIGCYNIIGVDHMLNCQFLNTEYLILQHTTGHTGTWVKHYRFDGITMDDDGNWITYTIKNYDTPSTTEVGYNSKNKITTINKFDNKVYTLEAEPDEANNGDLWIDVDCD